MGGWEALGGINDALGIERQTGNYFLMIKSTLSEFFEKFFLDLFIQFDVCVGDLLTCMYVYHLPVCCPWRLEEGYLEKWPCFPRIRGFQLLVTQGPLKGAWDGVCKLNFV